MTDITNDIKKTLLDAVKTRITIAGISSEDYHINRPEGEYSRPCFWMHLVEKKKAIPGTLGTVKYDYILDVTLELLEDADKTTRHLIMDNLFKEREQIQIYHYTGTKTNQREGRVEIIKFSVRDNAVDAARNRITAALTARF